MIAPMKKFTMVVWGPDARHAPRQLRALGVAHVEHLKGSGEGCAALEAQLRDLQHAHGILGSRPTAKNPPKSGAVDEVLAETLELSARIAAARDEASRLVREADRVRPWGDFDPEAVRALGVEGLRLRLYEGPVKSVAHAGTDADLVRLSAPKGKARIAVFGDGRVPPDFSEFPLPAARLFELERRIAETNAAIADAEKRLDLLGPQHASLAEAMHQKEAELRLEHLASGMPAHEGLRWLGGYIPAEELPALKAEAARRHWALAIDDPADDDLPPTKVENPPLVRIIQPVFDFLGTVPGYREYDISAWFLGFFTLYFAMIFGDAGYGVIMLAAALFASRGSFAARRSLPDAIRLLWLLGTATVLWGTVTGTWFAIPYESLPRFMQAVTIPWISNGNPDSGTNIKILCFILGAIQLTVAHAKNILRDFPNPKFLAQAGSLMLIAGMFNAVLNLVIDPVRFPIQTWAVVLIAVGFLMVFTFGNWDGNLLKSLLEGLKGIIPTFLGTVSVFADIVSYIRLWAVGLAGVALAQTINGMASEMFGSPAGNIVAFIVGGIMGCVLLAIGHSLNLVMSVLSVIVHGIRLNTLEFSSHLGMEWSGYKYDPLRERGDTK